MHMNAYGKKQHHFREKTTLHPGHWDLWMHFTREMYQKGMLEPHKVDTTEERADIFTKGMSMKAIADYFKSRNDIMNIKHANA